MLSIDSGSFNFVISFMLSFHLYCHSVLVSVVEQNGKRCPWENQIRKFMKFSLFFVCFCFVLSPSGALMWLCTELQWNKTTWAWAGLRLQPCHLIPVRSPCPPVLCHLLQRMGLHSGVKSSACTAGPSIKMWQEQEQDQTQPGKRNQVSWQQGLRLILPSEAFPAVLLHPERVSGVSQKTFIFLILLDFLVTKYRVTMKGFSTTSFSLRRDCFELPAIREVSFS